MEKKLCSAVSGTNLGVNFTAMATFRREKASAALLRLTTIYAFSKLKSASADLSPSIAAETIPPA